MQAEKLCMCKSLHACLCKRGKTKIEVIYKEHLQHYMPRGHRHIIVQGERIYTHIKNNNLMVFIVTRRLPVYDSALTEQYMHVYFKALLLILYHFHIKDLK